MFLAPCCWKPSGCCGQLTSIHGQILRIFFEVILSTENLVIENAMEGGAAMDWYKLGADFADAMHLCITGDRVMYTFDSGFCKKARELEIASAVFVL